MIPALEMSPTYGGSYCGVNILQPVYHVAVTDAWLERICNKAIGVSCAFQSSKPGVYQAVSSSFCFVLGHFIALGVYA